MKNRTTLSLLFTVLPLFVIAQPTAEFSVDVSTGCEPLIVQFINNSTGNNLSYLWDFGNGNTSTDLNPMHDYPNAGTYSPCLTVTDDQGQQDSYCLPNPIEVYPSYHDTLSFTICQGDTILFGGVEYSSQGQYSFPYTTLMGCDSIIELHLSHYPNPTTMDPVYLCPGQACYTYVNGNCYEVGNHNLVFGSSNGCDSTVILTVQEVQAGGVLTLANIDTQEPSCFGE
ncbi:MAG TPA: PKD domain-containing protein, partial [Phaeodactylibacter sp.]|nr:PKD domain-containing protein [Phaeodactylibacter sp.]